MSYPCPAPGDPFPRYDAGHDLRTVQELPTRQVQGMRMPAQVSGLVDADRMWGCCIETARLQRKPKPGAKVMCGDHVRLLFDGTMWRNDVTYLSEILRRENPANE